MIGAGLSCAVGTPSTKEITKQILLGENLAGEKAIRHTDGTYYFGVPNLTTPTGYTKRILIFLRYLKAYLDLYNIHRRHDTNYEELIYLISQIYNEILREYENPIIEPMINEIQLRLERYLVLKENDFEFDWELFDLVRESKIYIYSIIRHLLNRDQPFLTIKNLKSLDFLKDCYQDNPSKIDVFTLNHDIVLEDCLKQNHIEFADGFGEPEGLGNPNEQARYWNPELFKCDKKVKLYKLHGSINWFLFHERNKNFLPRIGIPMGWDYWHIKDSMGEYLIAEDGVPLLLVGTYNKILDYVDIPIFLDLHYTFYNSLQNNQRLIIIGYSFGDKAINARLAEWMLSPQNNRLVIIDPCLDKIRREIPLSEFKKRWDSWLKEGKLILFDQKIECVSWEEIKKKIG